MTDLFFFSFPGRGVLHQEACGTVGLRPGVSSGPCSGVRSLNHRAMGEISCFSLLFLPKFYQLPVNFLQLSGHAFPQPSDLCLQPCIVEEIASVSFLKINCKIIVHNFHQLLASLFWWGFFICHLFLLLLFTIFLFIINVFIVVKYIIPHKIDHLISGIEQIYMVVQPSPPSIFTTFSSSQMETLLPVNTSFPFFLSLSRW